MDELVSVVSLKPSPSSSTEALLDNVDSPKESVRFVSTLASSSY